MTKLRHRGPQATPVLLSAQQRSLLRTTAKSSSSPQAQRRALAILALSRGERVEHVAAMLAVSKQSVVNWRDAWLRQGRPESLLDRERSGRPRHWTEEREELLESLLERSPAQFGYRALSWTSHLLSNHLGRVSGWTPSDRSIRLVLKELGYVYKRPRYVLMPDPQLAKKSPSFASKFD